MVAMDSTVLRNSSNAGGMKAYTTLGWKPFGSYPGMPKPRAGFEKKRGLALIDDDTPRGNNPLG
jgi:hypothetical protein